MKRTFAHIINPFMVNNTHEMHVIQPITFESMRRAKEHASLLCEVELFAIKFPEDKLIIPDYFHVLPDLERSVLDVSEIQDKRKLPLIKDVLGGLFEHSKAEYLIYTNVDIGLMPQFYLTINAIIDEGHDGFIINRRRIPNKDFTEKDLDLIYSEVGELHNGYDCFVFKRELFENFELDDICIGIPNVGNAIAHNLFSLCENFQLYTNKHLTFHLGMDLTKNWGPKPYLSHNKKSFKRLLAKLTPQLNIANVPGSGLPFLKRHFKWLMNPTLHYPTLLKLDLKQWKVKRTRTYKIDSGNKFHEWLQKKVKLEEK